MPKLKQPTPLPELAFRSVVSCTAHYCDALSVKRSLIELRRSIAILKLYLSNRIPNSLFMEFCMRFLAEFYSIGRDRSNRPDSHNGIALEIIMDVQFMGLTCEGDMLHYLNPSDVHRLRGLKVLDWTERKYHRRVPRELEHYNLQDVTTFICPEICTDLDLEIIGPCCLQLEVLRIQESHDVTDRGLRALSQCSELRIINIPHCPGVTDDGVNELLNVHKKMEEFNVCESPYDCAWQATFNLLSRPITSVCPSIKRFSLEADPVTNAHLHSIVTLFPNLNYLQFHLSFTGDLYILKDLKNLTKLNFRDSDVCFSMEKLNELLKFIGANITELTLHSNFRVTQDDLNFLSQACSNIELMNFYYRASLPTEKLIIPPFSNLKHLECTAFREYRDSSVKIELCEMSKLEMLRIEGFEAFSEMIEPMMSDNVRFPNLRLVHPASCDDLEMIERINETAKNNNLDFKFSEW